MKAVATTRPYYRSSYVFVTREKEHLQLTSFDDPRLNGLRIGLQIMEEDLAKEAAVKARPRTPQVVNSKTAEQQLDSNPANDFIYRQGEIV